MNSIPDSTQTNQPNLFWVLLILFVLLGVDYGHRLAGLVQQRGQLHQAQELQTQNTGRLAQAQQLTGKLQPLTLELLQIAGTNAAAKTIINEFQIQYVPPPQPPAAVTVPVSGMQTNR